MFHAQAPRRRAAGSAACSALLLLGAFVAGLPPGAAQAAAPDLVVSAAVPEPPSPGVGDRVVFNATLANQGNASAGNLTVSFLVDSVLIAEVEVAGPEANATIPVLSAGWVANSTGNHTLRVIADANATVVESDEANNELTTTFEVGNATAPPPPSSGPPLPELVAGNLTTSPTPARAGVLTTFVVNVRNDGNLSAGPFNVTFTLNGTLLSNATVDPGLAANTSAQVTARPWLAIRGDHVLEVLVDASATVAERDEGNNLLHVDITIGGPPTGPDLEAQDLHLVPGDPEENTTQEAVVRVVNIGTEPTPPSVVDFLLDGAALGNASLAPLGPGASVEARSGPFVALAGNHSASAVVDAGDFVDETDEENNTATLVFTVRLATGPRGPDLVVLAAGVDPAHPEPGAAARFHARVRNVGNAAAGPFTVAFEVNGTLAAEARLLGLAPGNATDVNATEPWNATVGLHNLTARADARAEVSELSEANNTLNATFEVRRSGPPPLPDLVALEVQVQPAPPQAGQSMSFTVRIANQGDLDAGPFDVEFLLGDASMGKKGVAGLAVRDRIDVQAPPWLAAAGAASVRVVVDADDDVPEADEQNNEATRPFTVAAGASNATQTERPAPLPGAWALVLGALAATAVLHARRPPQEPRRPGRSG